MIAWRTRPNHPVAPSSLVGSLEGRAYNVGIRHRPPEGSLRFIVHLGLTIHQDSGADINEIVVWRGNRTSALKSLPRMNSRLEAPRHSIA